MVLMGFEPNWKARLGGSKRTKGRCVRRKEEGTEGTKNYGFIHGRRASGKRQARLGITTHLQFTILNNCSTYCSSFPRSITRLSSLFSGSTNIGLMKQGLLFY